jgi:type I restriction enzyme M protein
LGASDNPGAIHPTKDVWYYEHPLPEGRKSYTKTQPVRFEDFLPCIAWWNARVKSPNAWKVSAKELLAGGCNLDRKNPSGPEDITHVPPEELIGIILGNEVQIQQLLGTIRDLLTENLG